MNKRLILNLLGISLFSVMDNNLILKAEASNISKTQEDLSPLITYTTEKIGDREKMRVTVTVEDRSGSGIKEFRDHNNNLINSNTITVEFNKRVDATFTAIDNCNNKSTVTVNLNWINPLIHTSTLPFDKGSSYWVSSNIREWLNSDKNNVSYTGLPPTIENMGNEANSAYDLEPGFLTNFTAEEQNAILVTERRNILNGYTNKFKDGGTLSNSNYPNRYANNMLGSYPEVIDNYNNVNYNISNDKVFLLSINEVHYYIEQRGFDQYKSYTKKIQEKYGYNNGKYAWYINSNIAHGSRDKIFVAYSNSVPSATVTSDVKRGISPAINLNPNYLLSNNKRAGELKIGDTVNFGTYLDEPIEWTVINISNTGIPLLITTYLIDSKRYDSWGDIPRLYSDTIHFENPSISMLNIDYTPTNGGSDITPPVLNIKNLNDLESRKNGPFSLNIEILDDDSGVEYVILPNGNKISGDNFNFEYTFDKNGKYYFKSIDKSGNYNMHLLFVSNINDEPIVEIKASTTEWCRTNVDIDVRSSNAVQYKNPIFINSTPNNMPSYKFPNYVSYAGAIFKIKGTMNLISYTEDILQKFPNNTYDIGFTYTARKYGEFSDSIYDKYPRKRIATVREIIEKGKIDFEIDFEIGSDYTSDLRVLGTHFIGSADAERNPGAELVVEFENLEYSIQDDSSFAINSIELPSGQVIENVKEYTDTITEDGIHNLTYKVVDNRGKVTQKTITVKVDKTAPTLDLNYNTNITNQNIIVNISASDATSGVKRIKLPNGNYINSLNSTYTISGDGEYTFECEDVAGNITTKTITINNIDKEKPNVVIDKNNTEWTNQGVQININTID